MKAGSMSEKEYLERLGGLFATLKSEMPQASDEEIFSIYRERELDLTIDFRLGPDFPEERRKALKIIQRQVLGHMEELKSSLASGKITANDYGQAIQRLVKQMKTELAKLLNKKEMEALCGQGFPGIPLDPNLIGRI
jgi:hypothetical protein